MYDFYGNYSGNVFNTNGIAAAADKSNIRDYESVVIWDPVDMVVRILIRFDCLLK